MPKDDKSFFKRLSNAFLSDEEEEPEQEKKDEEVDSEMKVDESEEDTTDVDVEGDAEDEKDEEDDDEEETSLAESDEWLTDQEGQLTVDVYQTDAEIVIRSTIAGVSPGDVKVDIEDNMVTINGERKENKEVDEENYYYKECYWGSFSRSIVLPTEIKPDQAKASLKNGVLTIRLPKTHAKQKKVIKIETE